MIQLLVCALALSGNGSIGDRCSVRIEYAEQFQRFFQGVRITIEFCNGFRLFILERVYVTEIPIKHSVFNNSTFTIPHLHINQRVLADTDCFCCTTNIAINFDNQRTFHLECSTDGTVWVIKLVCGCHLGRCHPRDVGFGEYHIVFVTCYKCNIVFICAIGTNTGFEANPAICTPRARVICHAILTIVSIEIVGELDSPVIFATTHIDIRSVNYRCAKRFVEAGALGYSAIEGGFVDKAVITFRDDLLALLAHFINGKTIEQQLVVDVNLHFCFFFLCTQRFGGMGVYLKRT